MLVVDELEVRQGELLLQQLGELVLDGLCPLAYEHDELVNVPCHTAARHLRVVALELGGFMGGLGTEVLLLVKLLLVRILFTHSFHGVLDLTYQEIYLQRALGF